MAGISWWAQEFQGRGGFLPRMGFAISASQVLRSRRQVGKPWWNPAPRSVVTRLDHPDSDPWRRANARLILLVGCRLFRSLSLIYCGVDACSADRVDSSILGIYFIPCRRPVWWAAPFGVA